MNYPHVHTAWQGDILHTQRGETEATCPQATTRWNRETKVMEQRGRKAGAATDSYSQLKSAGKSVGDRAHKPCATPMGSMGQVGRC